MRNAVSLIAVLLLVGCSGSNPISSGTSQAADTSTSTSGAPTNTTTPVKGALTISGQPVTALNINTAFTFVPTVSGTTGETLVFTIQNKPSWATFNTSTGELTGTPNSSNIGNYGGVVISVSNGVATSALPTFSIDVTQFSTGSVTLSWLPPTTNTNGTPLTNLAGYRIYYGTSPSSLTHSTEIANPGIADYVIDNLSPATWYFSLVSYNSADVESPLSAIVSKKIAS
jgi:Putative Ig domain